MINTPYLQHRRVLSIGVLSVVLLFSLCFGFCSDTAWAQDSASLDGTIPPYQSLNVTAQHQGTAVAPNDRVTFTVSLERTPANYPVTLGITNEVPLPLAIIPGSITFPADGAGGVQGQVIAWTATYTPSAETVPIQLSYVARTPECNTATQSVTNTVTLQELVNSVMITPTDTVSQTSVVVQLAQVPCAVNLPFVKHEVVPPFPQLVNGALEQGPQVGWTQLVNNKSEALIFPRASIPSEVRKDNASSYIAWLGGAPNSTNVLEQKVTLPLNYRVYLSLRYYSASEENNCGIDTAEVFAGTTTLKRYGLCDSQASRQWRRDKIDLNNLRGTTFELSFKTSLNGARNSNWFLDDFLLCSDDPGVPPGTPSCPS